MNSHAFLNYLQIPNYWTEKVDHTVVQLEVTKKMFIRQSFQMLENCNVVSFDKIAKILLMVRCMSNYWNFIAWCYVGAITQ